MDIVSFRQTVWDFYRSHERVFPWRQTRDPYAILVSEIMLQQTQTDRVVPKYEAWLAAFPTVRALAEAPVAEVLRLWQGLGYNRRALNLQKAAQVLQASYSGIIPADVEELVKLPGIGPYTAAAVSTFAFDQPNVFIETNIRRVFLHAFFPDQEDVSDKQLMPLIGEAIPKQNVRDWYYALMDYGAALAKSLPNPNRRSRHYTKQSAFEGSNRQLRGRILKSLVERPVWALSELGLTLQVEKERLTAALEALRVEGFLDIEDTQVSIRNH